LRTGFLGELLRLGSPERRKRSRKRDSRSSQAALPRRRCEARDGNAGAKKRVDDCRRSTIAHEHGYRRGVGRPNTRYGVNRRDFGAPDRVE
jgi:hypothetical protein